jgi:small-conductance mechanosensitive channel
MFRKLTKQSGNFICLGLPLLFGVLMFFLWVPVKSAAVSTPMQLISSKRTPEIQIPKNLSGAEIDSFLASLSDEQVRKFLAQKLKQEAEADAASLAKGQTAKKAGHHADIFYELEQRTSAAGDRIISTFSSMATSGGKWSEAFGRLAGGKGGRHLLLMLVIAALMIGLGFFVERFLGRYIENFRKQLLAAVPPGKLQKLGRFISRLLLDALSVFVFMFTTFVLFVLVYDRGQTGYGFVSKILIISYYFRVVIVTAKVVLSPASPSLRLLPLIDDDAVFLYRWFTRFAIVAAVFAAPGLIFRDAGGSLVIFTQIYSAAGLSLTVVLLAMIWKSRKRVAAAISGGDGAQTDPVSPMRVKFAKTWHYFASLYAIGIGGFWMINVLISGRGEIIKLIASLFLIPIFIGLDQWGQRLLKMASGELPETIDLSGDDKPTTSDALQADSGIDIKHYVPVIKKTFRIVLVAFLFFLALRLWGIDLSIGRIFTSHALTIIVTLILGFFVWEFTKARIDRKLREEMPDQDEDAEEGGAGGSRSVTLLLLLRKFLLAVMFMIVGLAILSSIGVNIAPLIAGAGVIGLAIGFGAQTLVKDIISGLFFLVDDAFRVGDFVETAGTKGMVEHISLRSMRLRHPRGMVYTIPFGGLGSVTNFSRDYIITKLDVRVRYEADIDKIRKIIKRINLELQNHEEIGSKLLGKIKSQGVREMDDSAMIVRVKFKTIPGEQFVIRREVYRRIQELFREYNIEFAHRNVTVYLPPDETGTNDTPKQETGDKSGHTADKKVLEAGAAAAIAASQVDVPEKKPKEGT